MSFVHEYYLMSGKKSLKAISIPFDLRRYEPHEWVTVEEDADWIVEALDDAPHFPALPAHARRRLRRAAPIELKIVTIVEWSERGKRKI